MKNKKNPAADPIKKFFKENPEAQKLLNPTNDGFVFSKEIRDLLAPFGNMDVREVVKSVEFMKTLSRYAGMSEDQIEEILNHEN